MGEITKNKTSCIKILILHIVALVGLALLVVIILKAQFYSNAQKAFSDGKYEVFAHYFNLSGKDNFEISDDLKEIPYTAFDNCENIEFNEYKGCHYLGNKDNSYYALVSVKDILETYEIHPQTVVICDGVFRGCKNIQEFIVPEGNEHFTSIDGTLYSEDMSRLIHYATGNTSSSFVLPETVKTIDAYAFYYDSHLKNVTLPNDLQKIGECAFGYTLIESITLPNTAVIIETGAFSNSAIKIMMTQTPGGQNEKQ